MSATEDIEELNRVYEKVETELKEKSTESDEQQNKANKHFNAKALIIIFQLSIQLLSVCLILSLAWTRIPNESRIYFCE